MGQYVVQTELEPAEYSALTAIANKHKLTVKEALRKAALQWVEENSGINPNDPIFRTRAKDWGKGTENASKEVDKILGRVHL